MATRKIDHLAVARESWAIAQSGDPKGEAYRTTAKQILAAKEEQPELTWPQIASAVGCSETQLHRLLKAFRNTPAHGRMEMEWDSGSNKRDEVARKVLSDPAQRREVIQSLAPAEVENLIEDANDVAIDRLRAKRAEHSTSKAATTRDLMGDDPFDPAKDWADNLILRVHTNARALDGLVQRAGLVLGSLSREEAFEYLQEAERQIAEVRAAVQEQLRDSMAVS